jgi:hypothetical protein
MALRELVVLVVGLSANLVIAPGASGQTAEARSSPDKPGYSAVSRASAQASNPVSQSVAVARVPAGTTICAVLTKGIDAKKAKPGDALIAKASLAVVAHGKIVIANGAKIAGRITAVKAHSRGNPASEVEIVFDHVALKEGGTIPLALTVQAIGYGGWPAPEPEDPKAYGPYAPASNASQEGSSPNARHTSGLPPRLLPADPADPAQPSPPEFPGREAGQPALDAASKGMVRLPGLRLTEGLDEQRGSVISSSTKNVKLERGSELILRVIDAQPTKTRVASPKP